MKNIFLLFLIALIVASCSKPKSFCDCLGEEADSMEKASKSNYDDYETVEFNGVSDECKKILEPYTGNHDRDVAFYVTAIECTKGSQEDQANHLKYMAELRKFTDELIKKAMNNLKNQMSE